MPNENVSYTKQFAAETTINIGREQLSFYRTQLNQILTAIVGAALLTLTGRAFKRLDNEWIDHLLFTAVFLFLATFAHLLNKAYRERIRIIRETLREILLGFGDTSWASVIPKPTSDRQRWTRPYQLIVFAVWLIAFSGIILTWTGVRF